MKCVKAATEIMWMIVFICFTSVKEVFIMTVMIWRSIKPDLQLLMCDIWIITRSFNLRPTCSLLVLTDPSSADLNLLIIIQNAKSQPERFMQRWPDLFPLCCNMDSCLFVWFFSSSTEQTAAGRGGGRSLLPSPYLWCCCSLAFSSCCRWGCSHDSYSAEKQT